MFGISWMEMLFLLILALLLFGGKRIPELARSLGKGISEFKRGVRDLEGELVSSPDNGPAALPSATPVAQSSAPAQRFDPYTGAPVAPPAAQPYKFDPYTGKPLTDAGPETK